MIRQLKLHIHTLYILDFSDNCELVRRTPLSCLCSTALGKSSIAKVKVDAASKVGCHSFLHIALKHEMLAVIMQSLLAQ